VKFPPKTFIFEGVMAKQKKPIEQVKVEFIGTIFAGKGNEYRKGEITELTPEQVEKYKHKIKVL